MVWGFQKIRGHLFEGRILLHWGLHWGSPICKETTVRDRTLVVVLLNIPFPFCPTKNQQVKVYWVRTEFFGVPFGGKQN